MRALRWTIFICLAVLELVMKAHVWFLIARASVFNGSDGFHRAYLIDRAIYNFFDWWLVGTKSTESWGLSLWDVTNEYVHMGADGGVITLSIFITIIVRCFRGIGRSVAVAENSEPRGDQLLLWALGSALLAHVVTFISVSYYDQNCVNWYLLLAMVSTVCGLFLDSRLRISDNTVAEAASSAVESTVAGSAAGAWARSIA